jgi:twinkle protein
MIEDVKKKLQPEMDKAAESDSFKTTANMRDDVIELLNDPESDSGQPLLWKGVELCLKPEMYVVTGIPSSGKSTWLDNLMMNSIKMHKKKWAVFSPESHPVELHMKQLIEIGTSTNFYGLWNGEKTTEEKVDKVLSYLIDKLFMLTPSGENLAIEKLLGLAEYLIEERGVTDLLIDPYNEFSHTRPSHMSETEYVSRFLGDIRRFINKHKVAVWIVAHPAKLRKTEVMFSDGSTGEDYPVPTAYDISGSANWYNKPDNIIAIHRDKDENRNPDNMVTVNVQKVRRKTTGKIGVYPLRFVYKYGTYEDKTIYGDGRR